MVLLEQGVVPPFPCPAPGKPKSQDGGILHTRKGVHVPALSSALVAFCLTSQEIPVSLGENAKEEGMGLALWLWLMGNKQV